MESKCVLSACLTTANNFHYLTITADVFDSHHKLHKCMLRCASVSEHKQHIVDRKVGRLIRKWGFRDVYVVSHDHSTILGNYRNFIFPKMIERLVCPQNAWNSKMVEALVCSQHWFKGNFFRSLLFVYLFNFIQIMMYLYFADCHEGPFGSLAL